MERRPSLADDLGITSLLSRHGPMVAIAFVLVICALMLMAVMSVQIRDAEREQADAEREQACWAKWTAVAELKQAGAARWEFWEFEDMRERAVKDCMQIDD